MDIFACPKKVVFRKLPAQKTDWTGPDRPSPCIKGYGHLSFQSGQNNLQESSKILTAILCKILKLALPRGGELGLEELSNFRSY